jgi:hypothetical protein
MKLIREYIKELLNESEIKFSGILKIVPRPEVIAQISDIIYQLPDEAILLPQDKWHVTIVHQSILKPYRKKLKVMDKTGQLPVPPPIIIDPKIDHKIGVASGTEMGRQSWVVWIKNQAEITSYINEIMELIGGPLNPELDRRFHISVANLTGAVGDSVK